MKSIESIILAVTIVVTASCNQPVSKPIAQAQPTGCNVKLQSLTYNFPLKDLYPIEQDRNNLDKNRLNVNGLILDANFDAGAMKVKTKDEELDIQFNPLSASSAVASNLRLALKRGSSINSVCARAGASTLDLVSATITTND